MNKKTIIKTISLLILIISIPICALFIPYNPENAVRIELIRTGYIISAFTSEISPTQDIGPNQDCTYFCNNDNKYASKHGYIVKKDASTPWYVAYTL